MLVPTLATNGTALSVSWRKRGKQARDVQRTAGRDLTLYVSSVAMTGLSYLHYQINRPGWHLSDRRQLLSERQRLRITAVCVAEHRHLRDCVHTAADGHQRQLQCAGVGIESGHRHLNGGHRQHLHQHGCRGRWCRRPSAAPPVSSAGSRCRALPPQSVRATLDVIVFKPDGAQLTNNNFTAAQTSPTAYVVDLPVLPTTGSYTVRVLPYAVTRDRSQV